MMKKEYDDQGYFARITKNIGGVIFVYAPGEGESVGMRPMDEWLIIINGCGVMDDGCNRCGKTFEDALLYFTQALKHAC